MDICRIENAQYIRREFTLLKPNEYHCDRRDRASSSGTPYSTTKTVSPNASAIDHASNDGQPQLPTIGDVMAGTVGPEPAPKDKDLARAGKDGQSELFEYRGSDDEVLMGPVRKRSKVHLFTASKSLNHLLTRSFSRLLC